MRLSDRLRNILRFGDAVSEHVIADTHDAFGRDGAREQRNFRLLEEGSYGFEFTGDERADNEDFFVGNKFLRRIHRELHISFRIDHFRIDVNFAAAIHFFDGEIESFFFREAVRGDGAGRAV